MYIHICNKLSKVTLDYSKYFGVQDQILRLSKLQLYAHLQRQRCSRLVHFSKQKKIICLQNAIRGQGDQMSL
jgi:hypothetical protein